MLDGAKTGKTLLQERYSQDRNNKIYGTQCLPQWKIDRDNPTEQRILSRQSLPPFVMDVLREATERVQEECLRQISERFNALPKVKDPDLIAPWQEAEAHLQEMLSRTEENIRTVGDARRSAMDAIKAHVVREVPAVWVWVWVWAQVERQGGRARVKPACGESRTLRIGV